MEDKTIPTTFKYKNSQISVCLMLKKRNKDEKVSLAFWRFTDNGKRLYLASGFEFTEDDWRTFCNKKLGRHKDIRSTLQKNFDKIIRPTVDDLIAESNFSLDVLKNKLKRGDTSNVNGAFKAKINDLIKDNKIGNSEMYQTTYNALLRFKNYKSLRGRDKDIFFKKCVEFKNVTKGENKVQVDEKQINFQDLTPRFLTECDKFWRSTGVSTSTVAMRMRTLRSIINNEGKPYLAGEQYPFGKGRYLIPSSTRKNEFLPIEDIRKIEEYQTDHIPLSMARDMFLFMFYGSGMNFKDVCLLKFSDITFDKELKFYRSKVEGSDPQPVYVPLLAPMVEIIGRWGNKDQKGYIFPFLNGVNENNEPEIKKRNRRDLDTINANLKIIAAEIGLNTDISTNWARHSYVTHLLSELMLSETVVKQMVGHSVKGNVTAGYNHLTPKKRREINSRLMNPEINYKTIAIPV